MILYLFLASLAIMLVSFSGLLLFVKTDAIKRKLDYLVSFSVGTFLAVTFLDLIPEALHETAEETGALFILAGFLLFILLSRAISAYHHHHEDDVCPDCDPGARTTGSMVLLGDLTHNFVDGIVLATAFLVNVEVGIVVAVGILLHEIPQEISEYVVLIRAGYSRTKALLLNFLVSSSVLVGALITYFMVSLNEILMGPLLGIAAGNLLYIAASDLLPHLLEETKTNRHFIKQFSVLLLGVVVMGVILFTQGHHA